MVPVPRRCSLGGYSASLIQSGLGPPGAIRRKPSPPRSATGGRASRGVPECPRERYTSRAWVPGGLTWGKTDTTAKGPALPLSTSPATARTVKRGKGLGGLSTDKTTLGKTRGAGLAPSPSRRTGNGKPKKGGAVLSSGIVFFCTNCPKNTSNSSRIGMPLGEKRQENDNGGIL